MPPDDEEFLKLYEALNDRITDLAKNYRVLNDSHKNVELGLARLKTRVDTATAIVKWAVTPIAFISLILQIYNILR